MSDAFSHPSAPASADAPVGIATQLLIPKTMVTERKPLFTPAMRQRRHLDRPTSTLLYSEDGIDYITTRDPKILHQYFTIRHDAYTKYLKLNGDFTTMDQMDASSLFFAAMRDGECLGGGRMNISTPSIPRSLPMEGLGFSLIDTFPEYHLTQHSCCEFARISVKEEHRNGSISTHLIRLVCDYVAHNGIDYLFWISPRVQARLYRQTISNYVKTGITLIRDDVKLPHKDIYEYLQMSLSVFIPHRHAAQHS